MFIHFIELSLILKFLLSFHFILLFFILFIIIKLY